MAAVVMISELLVEIVAMAQRKLKPSLGWRRRRPPCGSVNRVRDSGAGRVRPSRVGPGIVIYLAAFFLFSFNIDH
jgi:hypothetical protein